ncbi:MAG: class II aldolase/adducin family protein [Candidatus Bathyarchaeota archaeon]|nr:MAG: class II aldolase/adducin family protein [Candidatus Bathyarchaeota archaeon]
MPEGRIRFNTIFVSDKIPDHKQINELAKWCETFQKMGLTPDFEGKCTGNLSFRLKGGFVITASGLETKENLCGECFVYVKKFEEETNKMFVKGKRNPSSEAMMHFLIYQTRKDVNAIFHGHNKSILINANKLGVPVTENEQDFGSIKLAKEALKVLGENNLVALRNHGFVSVGKTMREAGELALATLKHSEEMNNTK